jgi:hypothetical protein
MKRNILDASKQAAGLIGAMLIIAIVTIGLMMIYVWLA